MVKTMKDTNQSSIGHPSLTTGANSLPDIEKLYPLFREWVDKNRGYFTCASKADIKVWYEFLSEVRA